MTEHKEQLEVLPEVHDGHVCSVREHQYLMRGEGACWTETGFFEDVSAPNVFWHLARKGLLY